jgi:hypothetical protein
MSAVVTGIDQKNEKKCGAPAWISKGLQAKSMRSGAILSNSCLILRVVDDWIDSCCAVV